MVRHGDNPFSSQFDSDTLDLIARLRIRSSICRQILTRKSVQEGKPDRIVDLLDEAANKLQELLDKSA